MKHTKKLLGLLLAVLLLCSLLPWQTMAAAEEPEATPPEASEAPAPEETPEGGFKAPPTPDEPNAPATYAISVNGGKAYKDAACTLEIGGAAEGDTVWLKPVPPAGEYLIKWKVNYPESLTV